MTADITSATVITPGPGLYFSPVAWCILCLSDASPDAEGQNDAREGLSWAGGMMPNPGRDLRVNNDILHVYK